ncbi:MAG: hypothetical protein QOE29_103 [Gaiellaceae bacterium]|jgi:hypothetical protein|nr:hypothetical protein [Gaiellaceae bacterium]
MRMLVLVAVLFAVACSAVSAAPPIPPPKRPAAGPPPAWIHTASGDRWLGYSSYCWKAAQKGVCADYIQVGCTGRHRLRQPIPVRIGEVVTVHFGFRATQVGVSEGRKSVAHTVAGRTVRFRVERLGLLETGGRPLADRGNDASYVGCLVRR